MKRFNSPEEFIDHFPQWENELVKLRALLLSSELEEGIKWGFPVYMVNGKNVLGLGAFKSYVGIWFFNGVFLKDQQKVLMNAQEGKTKGMRQWRFKSANEMDEKLILKYIAEAIQNQKDGKEIKPEKKKPLILPKELSQCMAEDGELEKCFKQLSLSKKREYAEYITEAKRAATKANRLEKIIPMILEGKGLNDKYK